MMGYTLMCYGKHYRLILLQGGPPPRSPTLPVLDPFRPTPALAPRARPFPCRPPIRTHAHLGCTRQPHRTRSQAAPAPDTPAARAPLRATSTPTTSAPHRLWHQPASVTTWGSSRRDRLAEKARLHTTLSWRQADPPRWRSCSRWRQCPAPAVSRLYRRCRSRSRRYHRPP